MQKIRKNDMVKVIAGKYRGAMGQVLRIQKIEKNEKVRMLAIVQGINIVNKCIKKNPQKNEDGRIEKRESPIDISNLALYNSKTDKCDKIGFKLVDGKKARYFKSSGELVDV